MLRKLLRYDLKFVFKYWWIAAVTSLVLSVAGGISLSLMDAEKQPPALIMLLLTLTVVFSIVGLVAFCLLSYLSIYIRFYKNLFTDEGYLTFTLPVKLSRLLNAKLLTALITMIGTFLVLFADIFLLISIGGGKEVLDDLGKLLKNILYEVDIYFYLYLIQFVILLLLTMVFSALFLFCCITFGSIITKKAKVPAAIGIYYVANCVFSGFLQFIFLFGFPALGDWIYALPESMHYPLIALVLLAAILTFGLACLLLYALQYWMLHRKLNLN